MPLETFIDECRRFCIRYCDTGKVKMSKNGVKIERTSKSNDILFETHGPPGPLLDKVT